MAVAQYLAQVLFYTILLYEGISAYLYLYLHDRVEYFDDCPSYYASQLYVYKLVDSRIIFNTLYSLITMAINTYLDPPTDTIRYGGILTMVLLHFINEVIMAAASIEITIKCYEHIFTLNIHHTIPYHTILQHQAGLRTVGNVR